MSTHPEDAPVLARYPLPGQHDSDRETRPWPPGTVVTVCGPDEWQILVEDPGSYTKNAAVVALQTNYGQTCFDWGRQYDHAVHGTNDLATASTTPPYWVFPVAVVGGPCNDPTQPCYNVHVQNGRYTMPSTVINQIKRLQPGQWYILQAYILVTGTNPNYTSDRMRWDCTSPNPAEHWTNVTVRYCWSDYQQIIQAIAGMPGITVTDPLTVGRVAGRPF